MKLDSPWFDRIRAARKPTAAEAQAKPGMCEHPGCADKGDFRAPKGRDREGQYWRFCFQHVREYNQSFNYFRDMPDDAVAAWQKDSLTGHRPTWTMGVNRAAGGKVPPRPHSSHPRFGNWDFADPFNVFGGDAEARRPEPEAPRRRALKKVERNSLIELGLEESASGEEIKARFKTLVKRLHPDANGGDRATEDKLRAVIQAYNYLKQAGLC
ncbi:J domain-containing protein [Flaviflagellibacter deserti]|uniref:J domain-containing protein n=1 Tax=Flaviflagellibacter deserti TaxID=2267266 RepID=A0ABV9Z0J4_9HYPH